MSVTITDQAIDQAQIDQAIADATPDTAGNSDGGNGRAVPVKSGRPNITWVHLDAAGKPLPKGHDKALRTGNQRGTAGDLVVRVTGPTGADLKALVWKTTAKLGNGKLETVLENVSQARAYYGGTHLHHWDSVTGPVKADAPAA